MSIFRLFLTQHHVRKAEGGSHMGHTHAMKSATNVVPVGAGLLAKAIYLTEMGG
jgi:hypothetical protein